MPHDTTIRAATLGQAHGHDLVGRLRYEVESRSEAFRAASERCLALAILVAVSPLILALAALIRLTSPGPAFYRQVRRGLDGRPFLIVKLRSMTHQCEAKTGPCWSPPRDPRITRLGRILRDSHFDELPQLWNVIREEMSLIGPRPERPELTPRLELEIRHYRERERVRPGMTGLSQVTLPADVEINDVRAKVECDLRYIRDRSLRLDLLILGLTALKMALGIWRATRSIAQSLAGRSSESAGPPRVRLG